MITHDLQFTPHSCKNGHVVPDLEPNITEDTIFHLEGVPVGFYVKNVNENVTKFLDVANVEFNSPRVPKNILRRLSKIKEGDTACKHLDQHSAIIGTIPPRPVFRRNYITRSAVHSKKSAQVYIKAMMLTCIEARKYVEALMPEQYISQQSLLENNVKPEYQFTNMFTSAIANYNISAPYHTDTSNLVGCSNIILTRRRDSSGGHLHIPDYNLVIESANNSMIYYPAYANQHGVTPIHTTSDKGYRNSYIFYPLKIKEPTT